MSLFFRYFAVHLAIGYALVACAFWALFGLFDFMRRAEEVGVAQFTIIDALWVTCMAMPARLVDLSPFIAMLGVLYGLSSLVRHNELIAMRNAGVTPLRMSGFCVLISAAFMGLVTVLELGARPLAQRAELRFLNATATDGALFSDHGIWAELEGGYLYIESLAKGTVPSGVYWYEFYPSGALRLLRQAGRARIEPDGVWRLQDVTQKHFSDVADAKPAEVNTVRTPHQTWLPPALQTPAVYQLPVDTLSLAQLYAHIKQRATLQGTARRYGLEFWQRSLLPVSALILTLFAVPFVLGIGPRARMGGMIALGAGAGFVLYLMQQVIANGLYRASQSGLLSVSLPLCVLLLPALWLTYRVHKRSA